MHCRLVYASKVEGPWRPVGADNIIDAPDFLPLGPEKSFDSDVIFAGARPFRHDSGDEWMYYMGGDAGHDSPIRKSALGLATLRADGWISVRGNGTFTTSMSFVVTDAFLTVTCDFGVARGGAISIGVLPLDQQDVDEDVWSLRNSISLTMNSTDTPMRWLGSSNLTPLVGKRVKLQVSLEGDAMLYALGFSS